MSIALKSTTRTLVRQSGDYSLGNGDRTYEWEAGRRLKKVTVKWKPEDGIEDGCDVETGTILKIEFSNSNLLDADVTTTVASAHVYNGGVEITNQYAASSFEWTRDSGNTTADATWNAAHKGMKSVTINRSELSANTQFTCTLTKIQPCCGDIVVDEDGNLLYAASENGDVFFLDEDGYLCVENPQNSYKFDGAALSMDTTTSLGTVTATSWVYTASGSDKIVEFKYNAAGLRVQKDVTVDGVKTTTKYILNGRQLAEIHHQNDVLKFIYDYQKRPLYVEWNGSVYSYVYNLQGDVVGITDRNGTLIADYTYDPWGKTTLSDSSLVNLGRINPFKFRCYLWDEEVLSYWLTTRYYNPQTLRFINQDTLVDGIKILSGNLFAYCRNMPVMNYDIDGNAPRYILGYQYDLLKDMNGEEHWFYEAGFDIPQTGHYSHSYDAIGQHFVIFERDALSDGSEHTDILTEDVYVFSSSEHTQYSPIGAFYKFNECISLANDVNSSSYGISWAVENAPSSYAAVAAAFCSMVSDWGGLINTIIDNSFLNKYNTSKTTKNVKLINSYSVSQRKKAYSRYGRIVRYFNYNNRLNK